MRTTTFSTFFIFILILSVFVIITFVHSQSSSSSSSSSFSKGEKLEVEDVEDELCQEVLYEASQTYLSSVNAYRDQILMRRTVSLQQYKEDLLSTLEIVHSQIDSMKKKKKHKNKKKEKESKKCLENLKKISNLMIEHSERMNEGTSSKEKYLASEVSGATTSTIHSIVPSDDWFDEETDGISSISSDSDVIEEALRFVSPEK